MQLFRHYFFLFILGASGCASSQVAIRSPAQAPIEIFMDGSKDIKIDLHENQIVMINFEKKGTRTLYCTNQLPKDAYLSAIKGSIVYQMRPESRPWPFGWDFGRWDGMTKRELAQQGKMLEYGNDGRKEPRKMTPEEFSEGEVVSLDNYVNLLADGTAIAPLIWRDKTPGASDRKKQLKENSKTVRFRCFSNQQIGYIKSIWRRHVSWL